MNLYKVKLADSDSSYFTSVYSTSFEKALSDALKMLKLEEADIKEVKVTARKNVAYLNEYLGD